MSATANRLPLVLSLIAIVLGGGLIAQALSFQNTIGSLNDKVTTLANRVDTVEAGKVQNIKMVLGEGEIVNATQDPEPLATLEYHRLEPVVFVVHKGDTVNLTVTNMDHHIHSFVMIGYAIDTGALAGVPMGGTTGGSKTITFAADKAGVFQFVCGIDWDPTMEECASDHDTIVGYMVVLES